LHQLPRQGEIVILEKDQACTQLRLSRQCDPRLDHTLAFIVGRMGLAGEDELDGALPIAEQSAQAIGVVQQQIRALVGSEPTGKAECENIGVEHLLGRDNGLWWIAARAKLPSQTAAGALDKGAAAGTAHAQSSSSVRLATRPASSSGADRHRSLPQAIVQRRSASGESQVGTWTPLATCPTGTSHSGQPENKR
jgi:hypothetical protein